MSSERLAVRSTGTWSCPASNRRSSAPTPRQPPLGRSQPIHHLPQIRQSHLLELAQRRRLRRRLQPSTPDRPDTDIGHQQTHQPGPRTRIGPDPGSHPGEAPVLNSVGATPRSCRTWRSPGSSNPAPTTSSPATLIRSAGRPFGLHRRPDRRLDHLPGLTRLVADPYPGPHESRCRHNVRSDSCPAGCPHPPPARHEYDQQPAAARRAASGNTPDAGNISTAPPATTSVPRFESAPRQVIPQPWA